MHYLMECDDTPRINPNIYERKKALITRVLQRLGIDITVSRNTSFRQRSTPRVKKATTPPFG